jgi:hypothetical protein
VSALNKSKALAVVLYSIPAVRGCVKVILYGDAIVFSSRIRVKTTIRIPVKFWGTCPRSGDVSSERI